VGTGKPRVATWETKGMCRPPIKLTVHYPFAYPGGFWGAYEKRMRLLLRLSVGKETVEVFHGVARRPLPTNASRNVPTTAAGRPR